MGDKIIKEPNIRFAGFKNDWEQRKLGKEFIKVNERNDGSFGKEHWISVAKMYFQDPKKVQSNNIDTRTYVMREGDVAFEGHPNAEFKFGRFVANDIGDGVVSELFSIYRHKQEYDNDFWKRAIQLERMMAPIFAKSITSSGNSSNKLDEKHFLRQLVSVPELSEQRQIGSFFKKLDNLITLHQRKLELLKTSKKTMLQKMFPKDGENVPEIRFKRFTDAWKQHKLDDISDKVTTKNNNLEYMETFTNSAEYGVISQRDFFDKNISNEANLGGYYVVQNDDFVYNPRISTSAPVGPIKRNKLGRTGVMSPLYYVFKTHDIDNTFLETYFSTTGWHGFMKLNGDSGARADRFAIKDVVFREMPVPYPTPTEQQQIGGFFNDLDNLITLHQRKLALLKDLKKSMIQQMFI